METSVLEEFPSLQRHQTGEPGHAMPAVSKAGSTYLRRSNTQERMSHPQITPNEERSLWRLTRWKPELFVRQSRTRTDSFYFPKLQLCLSRNSLAENHVIR